jgi:RNA polymerase sigma-70 factor (TIGR02957 family)
MAAEASDLAGGDRGVSDDVDVRRNAFAVAYRMLGSVTEAEDVVQETLLRLHRARKGGEEISSPRAYAATVATRLAIDELRSARVRRERYVGDWLPEPLVEEADPAHVVEMADSLSTAFLVLLESLSPEQRAAFLLHDVFDYGYAEVAEIVGTSEANARQLATRARRHVEERKPRFDVTRERQQELADRFLAAARDGDLAGLEALLAEDVVLQGDGGGSGAPQLARALQGANRVARTLTNWTRALFGRLPDAELRPVTVNGAPGAMMVDPEGRTICVWSLEFGEDRIQAVRSVINPDKLTHVGPVFPWPS